MEHAPASPETPNQQALDEAAAKIIAAAQAAIANGRAEQAFADYERIQNAKAARAQQPSNPE